MLLQKRPHEGPSVLCSHLVHLLMLLGNLYGAPTVVTCSLPQPSSLSGFPVSGRKTAPPSSLQPAFPRICG